ncbi:MAG: Rieske 2Fe-2S domain-containing protein [Candidatus Altiarchaeota archaeon]
MKERTAMLVATFVAFVLISGCMESQTQATTTTGGGDRQSVVKVSSGSLGRILTDASGRTLYVFTKDESGKSNCAGQCAQNWPPLLVEGQLLSGEGVTGDLATIPRSDGAMQAAYVDMPLYYFAQDANPGDVKGQAVNGVWYVVNPDTGPVIPSPQATDAQVTTTQPQVTTTAGDPSEPNGLLIAKTADVAPGASVDFIYDGGKAILVNVGGTYVAYVNSCPHKGCATVYEGSKLTCPCHNSQFDAKSGGVLKGPATTPLTTISVKVVGDGIYAP